jgi:hypothetical protein
MTTDSFWIGSGFGCLVGLALGGLVGMDLGSNLTYNEVMQAAFDRGYAVQCLGREGYYWECEK